MVMNRIEPQLTGGERTIDPSSVQAEFEALGSVLAMLEKRIQALSERLDPIRRTDIPQKSESPVQEPPASCRVGTAVREARNRLVDCDSAVDYLIASIAL